MIFLYFPETCGHKLKNTFLFDFMKCIFYKWSWEALRNFRILFHVGAAMNKKRQPWLKKLRDHFSSNRPTKIGQKCWYQRGLMKRIFTVFITLRENNFSKPVGRNSLEKFDLKTFSMVLREMSSFSIGFSAILENSPI